MTSYEMRISRRARNLRLTVHPDGRVVITKPVHISEERVIRFIQKHADWIEEKIVHLQMHPAPLLAKHSTRDYKQNKEKARQLVHERIAYFNNESHFAFGSIRIGNQRSRWGSCSARGNLNFNYKIVFLPKELQDYVVVHELCHLKELNHSKKFWDLVNEKIPDWKKLKLKLKKY